MPAICLFVFFSLSSRSFSVRRLSLSPPNFGSERARLVCHSIGENTLSVVVLLVWKNLSLKALASVRARRKQRDLGPEMCVASERTLAPPHTRARNAVSEGVRSASAAE